MANTNGQGLLELADLISRREYNWGIVRSRVYEEELVHNYADETETEYTTLADTIDELWKKGVINDKSRENLHGIRVLGNKAVHEGDNDPQDAKDAYFMLKEELQVFADRGNVADNDRTPVMINAGNNGAEISEGEVYIRSNHRNKENTQDGSEDIDMSYAANRRRPTGNTKSGGNSKNKKKKTSGFDLYSVLKILIPVLIVVLLIILIKSLFPKKDPVTVPETSTAVETEAATKETEKETEETTTPAPTTEAPTTAAPAKYQIKGEGVNIRLADNPSQVYTQLGNGTVIGEVTDFKNNTGDEKYDDFAQFRYDSKDVIVSKKFIEKASN
ncbi:MAG: DUF4145 domain-containing protein [Lachnospiraceae bacterium]|nr:DUF4145 domain-containing protein [Lachnospiraceae bacterium]